MPYNKIQIRDFKGLYTNIDGTDLPTEPEFEIDDYALRVKPKHVVSHYLKFKDNQLLNFYPRKILFAKVLFLDADRYENKLDSAGQISFPYQPDIRPYLFVVTQRWDYDKQTKEYTEVYGDYHCWLYDETLIRFDGKDLPRNLNPFKNGSRVYIERSGKHSARSVYLKAEVKNRSLTIDDFKNDYTVYTSDGVGKVINSHEEEFMWMQFLDRELHLEQVERDPVTKAIVKRTPYTRTFTSNLYSRHALVNHQSTKRKKVFFNPYIPIYKSGIKDEKIVVTSDFKTLSSRESMVTNGHYVSKQTMTVSFTDHTSHGSGTVTYNQSDGLLYDNNSNNILFYKLLDVKLQKPFQALNSLTTFPIPIGEDIDLILCNMIGLGYWNNSGASCQTTVAFILASEVMCATNIKYTKAANQRICVAHEFICNYKMFIKSKNRYMNFAEYEDWKVNNGTWTADITQKRRTFENTAGYHSGAWMTWMSIDRLKTFLEEGKIATNQYQGIWYQGIDYAWIFDDKVSATEFLATAIVNNLDEYVVARQSGKATNQQKCYITFELDDSFILEYPFTTAIGIYFKNDDIARIRDFDQYKIISLLKETKPYNPIVLLDNPNGVMLQQSIGKAYKEEDYADKLEQTGTDYIEINSVSYITDNNNTNFPAVGMGAIMKHVFYSENYIANTEGGYLIDIKNTLGVTSKFQELITVIEQQDIEGTPIFYIKDKMDIEVFDKNHIVVTDIGTLILTKFGIYLLSGNNISLLSEPINNIIRDQWLKDRHSLDNPNWKKNKILYNPLEKELHYKCFTYMQPEYEGTIDHNPKNDFPPKLNNKHKWIEESIGEQGDDSNV